jgi:DNA-binding response OmpR family regulator
MLVALDRQKLTPTERRLLDFLSDGRAHTARELIDGCLDPLSELNALHFHIHRLRLKVMDHGLVVANGRRTGYQLCRRLYDPSD